MGANFCIFSYIKHIAIFSRIQNLLINNICQSTAAYLQFVFVSRDTDSKNKTHKVFLFVLYRRKKFQVKYYFFAFWLVSSIVGCHSHTLLFTYTIFHSFLAKLS